MKFTIDRGAPSALALCHERGCGWRGLAVSYPQALQRAVQHEETQHPGEFHARDRYRKWAEKSTGRKTIPRSGPGSEHGNQDRVPPRE